MGFNREKNKYIYEQLRFYEIDIINKMHHNVNVLVP